MTAWTSCSPRRFPCARAVISTPWPCTYALRSPRPRLISGFLMAYRRQIALSCRSPSTLNSCSASAVNRTQPGSNNARSRLATDSARCADVARSAASWSRIGPTIRLRTASPIRRIGARKPTTHPPGRLVEADRRVVVAEQVTGVDDVVLNKRVDQQPVECLRQGVNLVIVRACREPSGLVDELAHPRGQLGGGQPHVPSLHKR